MQPKDRRSQQVFAAVCTFVAAAVGFDPAIRALRDRDFVVLGAWLAVFATAGWFSYLELVSPEPESPPKSAPFSPLSTEKHPDPWLRVVLMKRFESMVMKTLAVGPEKRRPLFVVGISGVGKSVMARVLLKKAIPERQMLLYDETNYSDFKLLKSRLSTESLSANGAVFVFDQFESLLTQQSNEIATIVQLISEGLRKNAVVIVTRSDRFYDLRALGSLAPTIDDVFHVPTIGEELGSTSSDLLPDIANRLTGHVEVGDEPNDLSSAIAEFIEQQERRSPTSLTVLELEMAGAAVMQEADKGTILRSDDVRRLAERDLCSLYLENQLRGLGEANNRAVKLLFALSNRDPSARALSTPDLSRTVSENQEDCVAVLRELRDRRFLKSSPWRLSHDALGPLCQRVAGAKLDAWEVVSIRSLLAGSSGLLLEEHKVVETRRSWAKASFWLTALLGVLRVAAPDLPIWSWPSKMVGDRDYVDLVAGDTDGNSWRDSLDNNFIPVVLAFLIWADYVFKLTTETMLRVRDTTINRLAYGSWALVILGMYFGAVFPNLWMLSVAAIGSWLASANLFISRSTSEGAKNPLYAYAQSTFGFMAGVALAAILTFWFTLRGASPDPEAYQRWSIAGAAILSVLGIVLRIQHTSEAALSRLRGLLNSDYERSAK